MQKKTVEKLKDSYERIYGATDIYTCPKITILDCTDFEGYLVSCGYEPIIEFVIHQEEGEEYIENWKRKNQGQRGKKDILQDYNGTDGHKQALIKILKSEKTKYAPLIAEKLCELEKENLPPKILEFFQKIENGGII